MSIITKLGLFISATLYAVALAMIIVASEYSTFNYSILVTAIIITILLVLINRKVIVTFFKTNLFKNIVSNMITIFLSLSILGMINYFMYKNDYALDLTKAKYHSLSDQSSKVISSICRANNEMKLTLFAKRADWGRFLKLLNLYKAGCSKISLNAIDVEANPALVSINSIKENGTLLIEYKTKKYLVVASSEQVVTTKLAKIINPKKINIYYVTGHNETSFSDASNMGYSILKKSIEESHYSLKPLELNLGIPEDASAILILNPQLSFLENEISSLESFIKNGGGLITAFSPQFSENSLTNLYGLFSRFGLNFVNGIVLDRLSAQQGGQASIPIVNKFKQDHSIVDRIKGRTLFPLSGYFELVENQDVEWSILAESSSFPASWGERSFSEVKSGKATYNKNKDDKGPLPLFVIGTTAHSRIAVFSSSSFIANQYQGHANNFNLFLNTISWAVNDESLISVDRPNIQQNLVYLSDIQFSLIFYFAILLFPFIFFILGIIAYKRKMSR